MILRMLCPQAQRTAKMASPTVPFRGHRESRRSVFIWSISASMALRRRRSAISFGSRAAAGTANQFALNKSILLILH